MATAEPTFLEKIDEHFLLCRICSGRYKNAKMLPCLHSFCADCLETLIQETGKLICPLCRRTHSTVGGVEELSNNLFVNELVMQIHQRDIESAKEKKCQGCQEGEVRVRCLDCAVSLCDTCSRTHKILPTTRTHSILPIEEYESAKVDDPTSVLSPIYCTSHPDNQVKFYCDSCEKIICLECTVVDHPRPEHQCSYLKDAAAGFTKELADIVNKMKEKEKHINTSKTTVQQTTESLDRCYKTEQTKVNKHIPKVKEEIIKRIDENGRMVLKEMTDEYKRRQTNLTAQLKGLDGTEKDLTNAIEYAEHLMHYGNAVQMMSARKGMVAQTLQLMRMETETGPVEDDYMEFHGNDDFCQSTPLGTVQLIPDMCLTDVPKLARVGEEIHVTLTAKHNEMRRQMGSRHKPEIKAEMKTPDKKTQDMTVRHNRDGTFSLKSQIEIEGDYQLSVSVCEKPVKGSPVNVKVVPQERLVRKFGGKGSGNGQLHWPWGVTMTKSGSMIVGDQDNYRLQLFSLQGQHQRFIQFPDFSSQFSPRYSAVSEDGTIFTTDYGNKQIVVCDENGKLIRCFGKSELMGPFGIAISPYNGKVYVVDKTSHCIRIYSQNGVYIKSFGSKGYAASQFVNPYCITIESSQGNVYVSDASSHAIKVYSADGDYLYFFGSIGSGNGQLQRPEGLITDKHNNVYVCDYGNDRVQKFNSLGKFISVVDCGTDPPIRPVSVCITDEEPVGKIIIVEQDIHSIRVIMQ